MQVQSDELYKQGHELLVAGDVDKAENIFQVLFNSTLEQPQAKFSVMWQLANCYMKQGKHALALLIFEQVLNLQPDFVECLNNVGYVYKKEEIHDKAREYFGKVLSLAANPKYKVSDKDKADYHTNMGSMFIANGTPQDAINCFKQALKHDPENPQAKWNYSLACLEKGDYKEGFEYYDFGDRTERTKERKYTEQTTPIWDGTKGQTVCVYGEQGIGDEIMFASMIADLKKDCRVIIDAHPRLADLFRLSFPGTPVYGTRKTSTPLPWAKLHKVDSRISMGSLGKFYRNKKEDFPGTPYMIADLQLIDKYARRLEVLGDKPKIGISWKGGTKSTNKSARYIPLDLLKELLSLDADFVSLQYNKGMASEIDEYCKANNVVIHHWQDVVDDYDETAALVSNLDLIISVPQSVVHLAGALGKTTWQLCPKKALWQMGVYGEDMPWYSCVRNFWQGDDHKWEPVIQQVKEELCRLLAKSTQS